MVAIMLTIWAKHTNDISLERRQSADSIDMQPSLSSRIGMGCSFPPLSLQRLFWFSSRSASALAGGGEAVSLANSYSRKRGSPGTGTTLRSCIWVRMAFITWRISTLAPVSLLLIAR